MLQAVREVLHDNMQLVRQFAAALEDLTNEILSSLPRNNWRGELDSFFRQWEQRGIRANPDSISILKQVIAEREQLIVAGGAAINEHAAAPVRLDVTSTSEPPPRALKPIDLDPAEQTSYEAIQLEKEKRALATLGRAIMASHPPEKWLEYATRDANKVALSGHLREQFLKWVAQEQAGVRRIAAADAVIKGVADPQQGAEEGAQLEPANAEAIARRERILTLLGNDLNHVSLDAVKALRSEGFVVSTDGGFSNPLTIVVALPREYGAPDTLVLQLVWPWFDPPHWALIQKVPGTRPHHVVKRIQSKNAQRHADAMKARGATIQAQMGAYEALGSGGSLPFIAQGLDQLQTGFRNAQPGEEADSLISQGTAWFYENLLGWNAEDAKEAGEQVDQLWPFAAGIAAAGMNKIESYLNQPPKGRGVWDKGPAERGKIIHKQLGENLPDGFPVIDKFEDGTVTSIKSLDLGTPTRVLDPAEVLRLGREYVDLLAEFTGGQRVGVRIEATQIKTKVLEIAVPPGATSAQTGALHELVVYGASKRIRVVLIEVK